MTTTATPAPSALDTLAVAFEAARVAHDEHSRKMVKLALRSIVHNVLADRPGAQRIDLLSSDQGEWLTLSDVDGEEYDDWSDYNRADHYEPAEQAANWITWGQASRLGYDETPGWVMDSERAGFYHIDVPAFLAAEQDREDEPEPTPRVLTAIGGWDDSGTLLVAGWVEGDVPVIGGFEETFEQGLWADGVTVEPGETDEAAVLRVVAATQAEQDSADDEL